MSSCRVLCVGQESVTGICALPTGSGCCCVSEMSDDVDRVALYWCQNLANTGWVLCHRRVPCRVLNVFQVGFAEILSSVSRSISPSVGEEDPARYEEESDHTRGIYFPYDAGCRLMFASLTGCVHAVV